MISLGLDISMVSTGVVVLDDGKQVFRGVIRSKPQGKRPIDEIKRIRVIVSMIKDSINFYIPDVVTIEGLAFMARNSTSLVQLGAINYMIRSFLFERKINFYIVAPTSLKKFITSKGNSQKDQIMLEIYKKYGVTILDNNEADAYGLARIGLALMDKDPKLTRLQGEVINLLKLQK